MTNRVQRRNLGWAAALVVMLLMVAPAAQAAKPTRGATYTGASSQGEKVELKVSRTGKVTTTIPWAAACDSGNVLRSSTISKKLRVSPTGRFSRKSSYEARADGYVIHVDLNLKGRFTSAKRATGSFEIHAHVAGPDDHCHVDGATWTARRR